MWFSQCLYKCKHAYIDIVYHIINIVSYHPISIFTSPGGHEIPDCVQFPSTFTHCSLIKQNTCKRQSSELFVIPTESFSRLSIIPTESLLWRFVVSRELVFEVSVFPCASLSELNAFPKQPNARNIDTSIKYFIVLVLFVVIKTYTITYSVIDVEYLFTV